ncbi:MAG TPA: nitronate monooxygenase, partial [Baekduia sp.]|nr:nitronate monooxygenase [Baekduia sp.]
MGGLGSFGLYGYEPDGIRETIAEIRARTAKPFAVNVWLEKGDEVTPADVDVHALTAPLQPFFNELGVDPPASPERFLPTSDEQIEAVLDEAPAVLSFVFGVPSPAV